MRQGKVYYKNPLAGKVVIMQKKTDLRVPVSCLKVPI